MTRESEWTRLWTGAGAFLAALVLLAASPVQPEAASADCGENSGKVCWENESCVDILFYDQCTTEYKYYPKDYSDGGGGGSAGGPGDSDVDEPVDEDCEWGRDFIGWKLRGC